jgi:hypothetical protein
MNVKPVMLAAALALGLAACGDDAPQGQAAIQDMPQTPEALCTSASGALSYIDKRDDKLMADVKANKPVAEIFNGYQVAVAAEAEKARASNDWLGYCKAVDAWLTGKGY